MITVFTDGSSRGNPGPGGYGIVAYFHDNDMVVENGGRETQTTNNRMELRAALEALEMLKKCEDEIVLYTDSSYLINGATKWIYGWEKNGWKTTAKEDVENKDLWRGIAQALRSLKGTLLWKKIDGHAGVFGNELADMIATSYADQKKMLLFKGAKKMHESLRKGNILEMKKDTKKAEQKKSKKRDSRTPYSYVSMINGTVHVHKTWEECEKRVKGKNARYKKVFSPQEEQSLIQEWTLSDLLGQP